MTLSLDNFTFLMGHISEGFCQIGFIRFIQAPYKAASQNVDIIEFDEKGLPVSDQGQLNR